MKQSSQQDSNPLELLLTNLMDSEAVQSHLVDAKYIITFSYKNTDKPSIRIPLKGIFSPTNYGLTIAPEILDKYVDEFKTVPMRQNHGFKHLAHAYATYYYSTPCGPAINKMMREDDFMLTTAGSNYKLTPCAITDIKSAIILTHGSFQHKTPKTYETIRIIEGPSHLVYLPPAFSYAQDFAFLSSSEMSGGMQLSFDPTKQYTCIYYINNYGIDIHTISAVSNEKEILLPPGTEACYRPVNKFSNFTFFEATLLNATPDQKKMELLKLTPQIKRPSDLIQNYFLNHTNGLVPALRKMERVIFCIHFFARHSNNKDLTEFCQKVINEDEIIVLEDKVKTQQIIDEIALLTGSECSQRFLAFLKSAKEANIDFEIPEKRLKIYQEILPHLGNLEKIHQMTSFHLCIMHLINTPNILDLRTCRKKKTSMQILQDNLTPIISTESIKYLKPFMKFGVHWIQLTKDQILEGDKIFPITKDQKQTYKPMFENYSTSGILQCKKMLRQSPGIFFSEVVSPPTISNEALTSKMIRYLIEKVFCESFTNQLDSSQIETPTDLVDYVQYMNTLQLHFEFLKVLINKYFNLAELPKQKQADALIAAVETKNSAVILQALIEAKIDPDVQNKEGKTALMLAVSRNKASPFAGNTLLLLNAKANPNITSNANKTAFDYATEDGITFEGRML